MVQLEAARAITDLVRSTPVEAVLAKSKLPPISTRFHTISLLKSDDWAHQEAIDVKPSSPHADSACLGMTRATLNFSA